MSRCRVRLSYRDEVHVLRPVSAGVVTAPVGFGGAFPVVLVWAVVGRLARAWAVPAALVVAVVRVVVTGPELGGAAVRPADAGGCRAAAVPGDDGLAEHPGVAVLAAHGYRPRIGPILGAPDWARSRRRRSAGMR
jgi:hypothetical protein